KFTHDGTVEVKAEKTELDGRHLLKVTVIDAGIGMTAEQIGRVFEAFEQASSVTAAKYGGTGLGLSISRRLARLLGGDVWFESAPGLGTTAYLTVSAQIESKSAAASPTAERAPLIETAA